MVISTVFFGKIDMTENEFFVKILDGMRVWIVILVLASFCIALDEPYIEYL